MTNTAHTVDLNGDWGVFIEFEKPVEHLDGVIDYSDWKEIQVPGCWEQIEENKKADGPVWYRKIFAVSDDWSNKPIILDFGGVNYYCNIYLNGSLAAEHEGGWSGFQVRVEHLLKFNGDNQLLIKVYKQGERFQLRECLAGFLPDVGVIFGGIWKPVHLKLLPEVTVKDVFVKPRIHEKGVEVEFVLQSIEQDTTRDIVLLAEIRDKQGHVVSRREQSMNIPVAVERVEGHLFLNIEEPLELWSPEQPTLYQIELYVMNDGCITHNHQSRFGLKEVEIRGEHIYLNGSPLYIRGVLHWGWYGDYIAPIPGREEIREELRRVKESGFNLVKHCLYVPIQDYYELADEMGVLMWQELPMWLPKVTPKFKHRVFTQYEDIIREVRNHPSLIVWTLGCELDQSADSTFLQELYDMTKSLTDGAIVRDNSGSGECYGGLLKEYADFYDYHFYADFHFFPDLLSQFAGSWREKKPWMFGEFCDYDEFRDIAGTIAENGGDRPWWLKSDSKLNPVAKDDRWQYHRQEEKLAELNLPFCNEELRQNANRSAYVYRKAVLETVRTYHKITGYVITSTKDNAIATSAIFDDLGRPKQDPKRFRQINENTVITLTWDHRRDWVGGGDRLIRWDPYNYTAETFIRPHFFVSHYDSKPIEDGCLRWRFTATDGEAPIAQGEIAAIRLMPGEAREVGVTEIAALRVAVPTMLTLSAELCKKSTTVFNEWSFCVFPASDLSKEEQAAILLDDPFGTFAGLAQIYPELQMRNAGSKIGRRTRVVITSLLRPEHEAFMEQGGNVLYVQHGSDGQFAVKPMPFWRESLQLFHEHPVMKAYPHHNHTSLTLFGIATDMAFERETLPEHEPMMDRLDARKFELDRYMFETKRGQGKMMASTLRFQGGLGSQPTTISKNPGGLYLLETIMKYLLK